MTSDRLSCFDVVCTIHTVVVDSADFRATDIEDCKETFWVVQPRALGREKANSHLGDTR